ncbi:PEP-CTERM sorting domain-containing protein [Schlegelella sp. S2-27]|uniref:PEP-CTERM sorting domain-containing protein n=1 Tax=Caldimonas mangrovi TaxID=2944811 RepID=A0ABT0YPS1_9BURK|nr:PEP-CTERM sorting domain-containing protein [Caldimonas mangrovi]
MHTTIRHTRPQRTRIALACAAVLACLPAHAVDYTWTGGAGSGASFWDVTANWSPGLPTGTDASLLLGSYGTTLRSGLFDVGTLNGTGALAVTGGELRLNGAASSVGSLRMSGGRIAAAGTVTMRDFHWDAGEFSSDPFSDPPSHLVVTGNATFGNGGGKYMGYQSTLELRGRARWLDGASQLTLDGNLHVGPTGRFEDTAQSANHTLHLGGAFRNEGTYLKTGQGVTNFSMPYGGAAFDNTGSFQVQQGTVNIDGAPSGTWRNAGTIVVSRGAALNVNVFRYPAIEQSGAVRVDGRASFSVVWSGMHSTGQWVVGQSGTVIFENDGFDERSAPVVFSGGSLQNDGRLIFAGGTTTLQDGAAITGYGVIETRDAAVLTSGTTIAGRLLRADGLHQFPDGPGTWGAVKAPEVRVAQLDWGTSDLQVPRIRVGGDARLHGGPVYFTGDGTGPDQPGYRKVIDGWLSIGGNTTWTGETDIVGSGRISTAARRLFIDETAGELPTGMGDTRPVLLGVARFDNQGTYVKRGAGAVEATGAFYNAGAVRTEGSGRMIFSGTLDNRGTLEARGARIDVRGALSQWSAADRRLTGGGYIANGNAIAIDLGSTAGIARNSARIELRGAAARLLNSHGGVDRNALAALSVNQGSLRLLSGATLTTTTGLANYGTVQVGAGSTLDVGGLYRQSINGQTWIDGVLRAGRFEVAGSLWGAGQNGTVGHATLDADQVRLTAGRLDVDIVSAGLYDVVSIDGMAQLGGTLYADFGQTGPTEGLYRVLTASGGLSGSFSVLSNLDPTQYSVAAIYGTGYVDLQVARISALMETAAALPMAPVPEPETYALMLTGLGLVLWQRKRRRNASHPQA